VPACEDQEEEEELENPPENRFGSKLSLTRTFATASDCPASFLALQI
jgi:hypothetical protein